MGIFNNILSDLGDSIQRVSDFDLRIEDGLNNFFSSIFSNSQSNELTWSTFVFLKSIGEVSKNSGLNFAIGSHLCAGLWTLQRFGPKNILEEIRLTDSVIAIAMTEPSTGSDISSLRSELHFSEEGVIKLRGTKTFVTNGTRAEWFIVFVTENPGNGLFSNLTAVILNKDEVIINPISGFNCLADSGISEVHFDISVSSDRILNNKGGGFEVFSFAMEKERLGLAALHLGEIIRVYNSLVEMFSPSMLKENFFNGQRQSKGHSLAEAYIILETSMSFFRSIEKKYKEGTILPIDYSSCKVVMSDNLFSICEIGTLMSEKASESTFFNGLLLDALASKTYSGSNEIHKNLIASYLLKVNS